MIPDTLKVENTTAYLESESVWGVLRGLESFSELLVASYDRTMVRFKQNLRNTTELNSQEKNHN